MEGTYKTTALMMGLVGAGVIAMLFMIGAISLGGFMKKPVVEEARITHVIGNNQCIVDTKDTALSAKIVNNCNLPVGSKVIVRYEPGSREATIEQQ